MRVIRKETAAVAVSSMMMLVVQRRGEKKLPTSAGVPHTIPRHHRSPNIYSCLGWSRHATMLDNSSRSLRLPHPSSWCGDGQEAGQNEDEGTLFTFRRVAYLSSSRLCLKSNGQHQELVQSSFVGGTAGSSVAAASASFYNHATVILYNLPLACLLQQTSLYNEKRSSSDTFSEAAPYSNKKALRLYRMAFATMELSGQQRHPISTMLKIVLLLLTNSGSADVSAREYFGGCRLLPQGPCTSSYS